MNDIKERLILLKKRRGDPPDIDYAEEFIKNLKSRIEETEKTARVLTTRGRKRIKEKNFALPGGRYPIHDLSHARSALSMVAKHGTSNEKSIVRSKVYAKYPGIRKRNMKKQAYLKEIHDLAFKDELEKIALSASTIARSTEKASPGMGRVVS